MNRNKQIRFGVIGDGSALFERNESIVLARVNHFRVRQLFFDFAAQAQCNIKAEIFFHQAVRADRSGIVATVAGIDDDAADFQPERAGERTLAVASWF